MSTTTTIPQYLRAAYHCLAGETHEETRVKTYLSQIELKNGEIKYDAFAISATQQLVDLKTGNVPDKACDFRKAFAFIADKQFTILVVLDYQHRIKEAPAYRPLKDLFPTLKDNH